MRITRGLPHLRTLRSIMEQVYSLFESGPSEGPQTLLHRNCSAKTDCLAGPGSAFYICWSCAPDPVFIRT